MKKTITTTFGKRAAQLLAGLAVTVTFATAQVPQPGIVLYGKVIKNGELVTDGKIEWTYTPEGGEPVTVEAYLRELASPGGDTYSYSATIPSGVSAPGFPESATGLLFDGGRLNLTRMAALGEEELRIDRSQYGNSFSLSSDQALGLLERVDLIVPSAAECCPGDADRSGMVNLLDYRSVRDAFGDASPETGDANCDFFVNMQDYAAVRDHFGETCGEKSLPQKLLDSSRLVAAGALELLPDKSTLQTGEEVRLTVTTSTDSPGAQLAGVFVTYDPGVLRFSGSETNTAVFNDALRTGTPREVQPGVIAFSAGASERLGALSSLSVATLKFTAVEEGSATFALGESMLMDSEYDPIPVELRETSVTVQAATGGDGSAPAGNNSFILY